jgi:hypothetical protein
MTSWGWGGCRVGPRAVSRWTSGGAVAWGRGPQQEGYPGAGRTELSCRTYVRCYARPSLVSARAAYARPLATSAPWGSPRGPPIEAQPYAPPAPMPHLAGRRNPARRGPPLAGSLARARVRRLIPTPSHKSPLPDRRPYPDPQRTTPDSHPLAHLSHPPPSGPGPLSRPDPASHGKSTQKGQSPDPTYRRPPRRPNANGAPEGAA